MLIITLNFADFYYILHNMYIIYKKIVQNNKKCGCNSVNI